MSLPSSTRESGEAIIKKSKMQFHARGPNGKNHYKFFLYKIICFQDDSISLVVKY